MYFIFWQVRVVNVEKEKQVMEDVIRKLDRHENENLPQVQLGTTEVLYIHVWWIGNLSTSIKFQAQLVGSHYTLQHNYLNFNSESLVQHHSSIPWHFLTFLCSVQIIFKDVQFLEKQTATLEIVNIGQVSILGWTGYQHLPLLSTTNLWILFTVPCPCPPSLLSSLSFQHLSNVKAIIIWLATLSRQDDPIPVVWLTTQASKMAQSCFLRTVCCVPQEKFPESCTINPLLFHQTCSVKMAGFWPCSFFVSLWTTTPSQFLKSQKQYNVTLPISSHLDFMLSN